MRLVAAAAAPATVKDGKKSTVDNFCHECCQAYIHLVNGLHLVTVNSLYSYSYLQMAIPVAGDDFMSGRYVGSGRDGLRWAETR